MHGVHLIKARQIADEQYIDKYEIADNEFEEIEAAEQEHPTTVHEPVVKDEEPEDGDASHQSSELTDAMATHLEQLADRIQRRIEHNIARAAPSTSPSLALSLQRKRAPAVSSSQLEDHHFLFRVLM